MKISEDKMKRLAKELDIKKNNIPYAAFKRGVQTELEHGPKSKGGISNKTDVTHGNLKKTAKIAKAHLLEGPKYYQYLDKLEKKLEKPKRRMFNGKGTKTRAKATSQAKKSYKKSISKRAKSKG